MKKYCLHIILVLVLGVNTLSAQVSYTNKAILAYQESNFEVAMKYIDSALVDSKEKGDAYTWYVKGMIYKDHYKAKEATNNASKSREIAIQAFKTCVEFDSKKEHTQNSHINIKFLAGTYYNDMVRLLDTVNYMKAEPLYEKYKETMRIIDPNTNFVKTDKEVYLYMGRQISRKFDFKRENSTQQFFDEAIRTFEKVIALDSNDCSAHYQIAQLYYNYGVETILTLDDNTPLEKVIAAQDKCVVLFQKSLPHMKKALQLGNCKSKKELLKALMGIYYQLNEIDKYNDINSQLKEIGE